MDKILHIVDLKSNKVVNIIVAWQPPEGCIAVESKEGGIGWNYDSESGKLTSPKE